MNIESAATIHIAIFLVSFLQYSIDGAAPNSPNYYDKNEGWDNDGRKIEYCTSVDVIKEDLRRENAASTLDNDVKSRTQLSSKEANPIVRNGAKEIGFIILSMIARAALLSRISGLPFDMCYFDEEIKRSLCAAVMKITESFSKRRLIKMADMKKLFQRHDYTCEPIAIHGFGHSKMMFSCPFKIKLAYSMVWYIDGFHLLQSKSTNNRVYVFRAIKSAMVGSRAAPIGLPIAEINDINLEKGCSLHDISRILFP